jgi:hypothetical protein
MNYKSNFERSCCYYISNKMNDLRIRMNTSVTVYSSFSLYVSQWHTTNAPNYHRKLQHWCHIAISSILCSPNPYVLRTIIISGKKYIYVFPLLLNKKHRKRDEDLTINRRLRLQSSNEESCKQLKQQISNCFSQNRGISSKESHLFGEGKRGEEDRGWQKQ